MTRFIWVVLMLFCCTIPAFSDEISGTISQGFRDHYRNLPGIGVYKNALTFSELNVKRGEFDVGIWASMGLGKRDIFDHQLGNEIDFYLGWRRRWEERFETYLRASYFMNDFRGSGIDYARDDQWIIDAETSFLSFSFATPYIRYRYFGGVGTKSPHPGSFWWLGARRSYALRFSSFALPFRFEGNLAWSDGALGRNGKDGGFIYGRIIAAIDLAVSDTVTIVPNAIWQITDGSQHGSPRDYAEKQHVFAYGVLIQKKF